MTAVELTAEEARVAGSLAEKQLTTPQYYPLTLNALVNACNQSNNRDPVVAYDASTVESAIASLREKGLVRIIHAGGGNRTSKYRQVLEEALGLDRRELALMTVLLLRGPQTVNELRSRSGRMLDADAGFAGNDEVEHDLARLSEREDALTRRLERQPGQKEARWEATIASRSPARPRTRAVRLPPLDDDALDDQQRELLAALDVGGRSVGNLNIFRTFIRHPRLFRRWSAFGGVLLSGELPGRLRELAILRTAWLTKADYEWGQHVPIAIAAGLSGEEVERVTEGPDAAWPALEAAVLRAADELHRDSWIGDRTWQALQTGLDETQLIELVFVIGQYHLVAFALNTLGVARDDGVEGFPR